MLAVESNFSLSENPAVRFHYVPKEPGKLSVRVTDSDGDVFARAWSVPTSVAKAPGEGEASPVNPVQ